MARHGELVVGPSGKNSPWVDQLIIGRNNYDIPMIFFVAYCRSREAFSITSASTWAIIRFFVISLHYSSSSLSASAISIAYGLDVRPAHDPNIARCEAAISQLNNAALDGNYLVDTLPILKYIPSWMPGAGFKAYAEKARPKTLDMFGIPYIEAREQIVSSDIHVYRCIDIYLTLQREGTTERSVVSSGFARGGHSIDNHPEEDVIRDVAAITYAGKR